MAYNKQNLSDGERLVLVAHKHVFVLLRAAFQWIALFFVALIVLILVAGQPWADIAGTIKTVLLIVCFVAMVVSLIAFGVSYLEWQAEQYIVTNERVIQVQGIVNKRELATSLDKVNDIETDQTLFGRMFNYGTVDIITGSDIGINKLKYLDKPLEFKKVMLNAKNRYYGDASDAAPGGVNYQRGDGENAPVRRVAVDQGYDPYPANPRPQPQGGVYQNDPRGYAPPQQTQYYNQPVGGNYGNPQPQAPVQPQPSYGNAQPQPLSSQQIADSIQSLARLRDNGIITEAEFQAKKNELMNRL